MSQVFVVTLEEGQEGGYVLDVCATQEIGERALREHATKRARGKTVTYKTDRDGMLLAEFDGPWYVVALYKYDVRAA